MKGKRFTLMLIALLCVLITLCSCGTFNPAGGGFFGGDSSDTQQSDKNPEIDYNDEDLFSVTLTINGREYEKTQEIEAIWSDDYSLHKSTVGENGIALADGLDGDYNVSLVGVPDGYAYDPNGYKADNNNRHITIDLRSVKRMKDNTRGGSLNEAHRITQTGAYEVVLQDTDDVVYFCYEPTATGKYSVESWVDINVAEINPKLQRWYGMVQTGFHSPEMYDGGGASGAYTKNFKFEIEIPEGSVGQSFTFGLMADTRKEEYPLSYIFAVKLNDEFPGEEKIDNFALPTEDFVGKASLYNHEYSSQYTFVGAEIYQSGARIFDETKYGLNETDGWYHLLENGEPTGPILYAKISQACRFYDQPLTTIEYAGNKALTIKGVNYKFFIEGRGSFRKGYFCVWHDQNDDYCPCMENNRCDGACVIGCEKCHEQCRNVSQELLDSQGGYADHCNSDGVYPVTQELKEFLQAFSISQSLFFDGNGHVETHPTIKVYADEKSQWLFACGYYA